MAEDRKPISQLAVVSAVEERDDPEISDAIASVELHLGDEVYLRLRADLEAQTEAPGRVRVRRRDARSSFLLYDMEWKLAQLMDGSRTIPEIAAAIAAQGIGATPATVKSFSRELKGYGFLEEGADEGKSPRPTMRQPPVEEASAEVAQLLSTAMALRARGDFEQAKNYLLAVLEIEPSNRGVRDLLQRIEVDAAHVGSASPSTPPVLAEPSPSVRTTSPERPLSGLHHRSLLPWVVSLSLVALVGVIAAALVLAPRLSSRIPREPPLPAPERLPQGQVEVVQVLPESVVQVKSTVVGVVSEVPVTSGANVIAGTPVAVVMGKAGYARVSKLKSNVERLSERGQKDTVSRFLLDEARRRLDKALRGVQTTVLTASLAGAVTRIVTPVGTAVGVGDSLVELSDSSTMSASLPLQKLPAAPSNLRCELPNDKARRCQIGEVSRDALGQQAARLLIENPNLDLKPGQWVDVRLVVVSP